MPDVFSKPKRSQVMAAIRSRGNKETELRLLRIMRLHGITGWRRHQKLTGRPDFIFQQSKVAIFVDGCFWHGCPRCYRRPKTNRKFWDTKVTRNRARDKSVNKALRQKGWTVIRFWDHELKFEQRIINRILKFL
ncbi:MAG TPA: very short patch repair endonuclease [Verrucomicrobiae bacterium]